MTVETSRFLRNRFEVRAVRWDGTAVQASEIVNWIMEQGEDARYWTDPPIPASPDGHQIVVRTDCYSDVVRPGDYIVQMPNDDRSLPSFTVYSREDFEAKFLPVTPPRDPGRELFSLFGPEAVETYDRAKAQPARHRKDES